MLLGVPRMMSVTDFYLWALVANICIVFGTVEAVSRLQRVLPEARFAAVRASSAKSINHAVFNALEAAAVLLIMPLSSIVLRLFVYALLAYTTGSLCSFLLLLELAVANHCYHYLAGVVHRTVLAMAILYTLASAASWGTHA